MKDKSFWVIYNTLKIKHRRWSRNKLFAVATNMRKVKGKYEKVC